MDFDESMNSQAGSSYLPSNSELKFLLDQAVVRFQNWKIDIERNPNPRMVHSLKNIIAIINSLSKVADQKIQYSYKVLCEHMAFLLKEVSDLNVSIITAVHEDDLVDEEEEEKIISGLMKVVQSATELIKIVQSRFGIKRRMLPTYTKPGQLEHFE